MSAPNEDYQEVYNRAARVLGYHESTDMQLAHAAEPGLYLLTGPVGTAVRATSNIAAAALIAQGGYEIGQGNYSEGVVQIVNGALLVSASTLTPKNVGKVSGSLVEADVSTTLGKELDLTTSTLTKLEEVSAKNTLVNNDKNTNLLKNIFEDKNRTVLADIEAQNVIAAMHEVVTTKRAKSITVMTHADGTVSVGIAGDLDNSKSIDIIERTQANLDKMYGKGRYNVGTTSLYEADGIIPVKDGNVPGVCGEGKCVQAASQNPSPVTGFATMWRGDGPNPYPYTGLNMGNLSSNQMGFCATCNAPQNQAIYSNTANQNKIMQHNTVNTINKRLEP